MSGELENLRLLGQKAHRLGHGHRRLARDDAAAAAARLQLPGTVVGLDAAAKSATGRTSAPRRRACMTSRTEG